MNPTGWRAQLFEGEVVGRNEVGAAAVVIVLGMTVFLACAAIAIDLGMLMQERTRLQATADAAALAAVVELPTRSDVVNAAQQYASLNQPLASVADADVVIGNWDPVNAVFAAGGTPPNAVDVTVNRTAATNTGVPLLFARVLGLNVADVRASATAWVGGGTGTVTRFLIDDEMIDSDEPAIEQLAQQLGVEPEDLISDLDGDWFIDLPPGTQLELPTGQTGDEALFDIGNPEWPYSQSSDPSFEDFLNFNEDGSWRNDVLGPDWDKQLDPLPGVSRVDDPNLYPSYVTPGCQVSPIYKSDVSALNPLPGGVPAVNAKGYRRGLLAFRIDAVGQDPDGSGSQLPNLIITICDPTAIPLATIAPVGSGSGGGQLQLVR